MRPQSKQELDCKESYVAWQGVKLHPQIQGALK